MNTLSIVGAGCLAQAISELLHDQMTRLKSGGAITATCHICETTQEPCVLITYPEPFDIEPKHLHDAADVVRFLFDGVYISSPIEANLLLLSMGRQTEEANELLMEGMKK